MTRSDALNVLVAVACFSIVLAFFVWVFGL
jgi:hypothetical protein